MIHPKIRRLARERALQFLYGLDHTRYDWQEVLEEFWKENPARPSTRAYADKLVRGVCDHRESLDQVIEAALDRWTPDRIGYVERALLRIGVYEMLHEDDVPMNVAINEAIEVAKRFGGEEAPRFVNGVLDRVRRTQEQEAQTPSPGEP